MIRRACIKNYAKVRSRVIKKDYYNVNEIGIVLGVQKSKAYQIIAQLNQELNKQNFLTLNGRLSVRYLAKKFYINDNEVMKVEPWYYTAEEVAQILGVSVSKAYTIIKRYNDELAKQNYIVVPGKISKNYFNEKIY